MKTNLQRLFEKITSRKFIAAMIGVIVGVSAACGIDASEYAETASQVTALIVQITGIVSALVSGVTYINAEKQVDVEREAAKRQITVDFPESYAPVMSDALMGDTESDAQ